LATRVPPNKTNNHLALRYKIYGHLTITPEQEHEINFGGDIVKMLTEKGIAVGNRGLYSRKLFENL
jgi:hypothetical protein